MAISLGQRSGALRSRLSDASTSAIALGLLVVCVLGYAVTEPSRLMGYEQETAAVSEALVRTGDFAIVPDPSAPQFGLIGEDGRRYGRTTLVQPVLEAPFVGAGWVLDDVRSDGHQLTFRLGGAKVYNAVITAVGVVSVFGIVLLRRRARRPAVATALLFAFASIAWPYSRIGMESTALGLFLAAVWSVLFAVDRPSWRRWALMGVVVGAAATSKPYAIVVMLPLALLPVQALLAMGRRVRVQLVVAALAPILVWSVAMLASNASRYGGITRFGAAERLSPTLAMPFNVIGLLASPGKGLVLYSPLVALGILGLWQLYREDRLFALTLLGPAALLTLFIGVSSHWSEETWGPRYIVPISGLLIIPIAWWATTSTRRRVVAWVAGLAVAIQLLGVVLPYRGYAIEAPSLAGVAVFRQRTAGTGHSDISDSVPTVPYGRDPMRWVPQMSPLLFQSELVASMLLERATGSGLTITYAPFEGRRTETNLTGVGKRAQLPFPDFWWAR